MIPSPSQACTQLFHTSDTTNILCDFYLFIYFLDMISVYFRFIFHFYCCINLSQNPYIPTKLFSILKGFLLFLEHYLEDM
jgi:hypothetical protein